MKRPVLLLAALLLMPWGAVGCRSCQSNLDYCGPLPDEPCDFMYRRNSILGGDSQSTANLDAATPPVDGDQENLPTPAPESPQDELPDEAAPMPMPPDASLKPQTGPSSPNAQLPRPLR